jgi:hypothetical protein
MTVRKTNQVFFLPVISTINTDFRRIRRKSVKVYLIFDKFYRICISHESHIQINTN